MRDSEAVMLTDAFGGIVPRFGVFTRFCKQILLVDMMGLREGADQVEGLRPVYLSNNRHLLLVS